MTAVGQAHARSASLSSARWRSTARWVAAHPDALALGAVGVISAVLTAMTWHRWGGIGTDSGYDIAAGTRVAHGHLPYADFVYYYGPLAPLLLGVIFWVGGASITSSVVFGLAVGVAILVATYLLARQLLGPFSAFVVTSLTAAIGFSPNEFGFVLPYSYDDALGLLFVLVLCLEIIRFARTSRRSHLVACGAALGLAGLAKPEFLLAGLGGVALWLLLRWRDGALRRGDLVALVVPAAVVMSAMYGYFLTRVSLHTLLFENLYPRAEIKAAVDTTLRSRAPLTLASLVSQAGRLALYLAGFGLMVLLGRFLDRARRPRLAWGVVGVAVIGAFAVALADLEAARTRLQLVFGWIPAGAFLAIVVFALWIRRSSGRFDAVAQGRIAALGALALFATTCYGGFFMFAASPQPAIWAMPLAALFLAGIHLGPLAPSRSTRVLGIAWLTLLVAVGIGLTLKDASAKSVLVTGPGGSIAERPGVAAVYGEAVRKIDRLTKKGEPIVAAPVDTLLYVLADRPSPLPRISLLPGALPTAADQRAIAKTIEDAHVRLIITNRLTFPEYGHTHFGGSFDSVLAAWIRGHYTHASTLRASGGPTLDLWLRSSQ